MDVDGDEMHREADAIVIQESLNEVLELVPSVPRLHRLRGLLRGMEWEEGHEDEEYDESDDGRLVCMLYGYAQLCGQDDADRGYS